MGICSLQQSSKAIQGNKNPLPLELLLDVAID
jgi:hypothetical protein